MTADRLLTDAEMVSLKIKFKKTDNPELLFFRYGWAVALVQDAKSIAEHNKWIASQKEAIREIIMQKKHWVDHSIKSKVVADAIISLLVGEAKS